MVQAEAEAEPKSESILAKASKPIWHIWSQLEVVIPSGVVILRASALAGVVLSAVALAVVSFFWLWISVSVPDSQIENVWLQYG